MIDDIAHLGLLDDEEIELDLAALELAALDHPDASLDPYLDTLEEMAEDLQATGRGSRGAGERADALARVIAGQYGFRGDRDTYDDPANADLMSVIDRRLGLPVSLSILYVALARRADWEADALGTPGHVLVSVGPLQPDRALLIDPFNRGAAVGADQLASLLAGALGEGVAPAPEHVAPMSNRAVLVRLLTNQATRAEQAGRSRRALELQRRITTVAPAYPHAWWERARLELRSHDVGAARGSLGAMLATTRDPAIRLQIGAALDAIAGSVP